METLHRKNTFNEIQKVLDSLDVLSLDDFDEDLKVSLSDYIKLMECLRDARDLIVDQKLTIQKLGEKIKNYRYTVKNLQVHRYKCELEKQEAAMMKNKLATLQLRYCDKLDELEKIGINPRKQNEKS